MIVIEEILQIIEDYFNLPAGSIQLNTRKREIVQARQIAMFFSKSLTKHSLTSIGTQIGQKDHATVLHACKTVNNLIDTDKQFKTDAEEIEKRLNIEIEAIKKRLSMPEITKEEIKEAIIEGMKKITDWKNEIKQAINQAIMIRFLKLIKEKDSFNLKMSMIFNIDDMIRGLKEID
jgi:regulator of replication initiation timing